MDKPRANKGPSQGPGWGGPARGAGNHSRGPGRPPGMKTGEGKKAQAAARLEEALPLAIETVISIAGDVGDQRALAAANSVIERVLGKVGDKLTLAGDAAQPLRIERVIVDPKGTDNA